MILELGFNLLSVGAYALLGIGLLALGFQVLDWVTPGNLRHIIYRDKAPGAALVAMSGTLALGLVIATSIFTSRYGLVHGLIDTATFGVVGILLLGLSFLLVDKIMPEKVSKLISEPTLHPGVWVIVGAHLATGLIMCAAIA